MGSSFKKRGMDSPIMIELFKEKYNKYNNLNYNEKVDNTIENVNYVIDNNIFKYINDYNNIHIIIDLNMVKIVTYNKDIISIDGIDLAITSGKERIKCFTLISDYIYNRKNKITMQELWRKILHNSCILKENKLYYYKK